MPGTGANEQPAQALLDLYMIREKKGGIGQIKGGHRGR